MTPVRAYNYRMLLLEIKTMEGIIFDIKHFAVHDGPGIRQTIFLKGCPLSCWWCHNPESQSREVEHYIKRNKLDGKTFEREMNIGYRVTPDVLMDTIKGDRIFFEESGGGVTFSGGEPLMQFDFLKEVLQLCKQEAIHTAVDTTGFVSQKRIEEIAPLIDLFLYDVKLMDNDEHLKYTGVPNRQILENLHWLDENNYKVRIRIPLIPGITDTEYNIAEIQKFLQRFKNIHEVDLLPYHNISNSKYRRFHKENKMGTIPAMQSEPINQLKASFTRQGLNVKIGG